MFIKQTDKAYTVKMMPTIFIVSVIFFLSGGINISAKEAINQQNLSINTLHFERPIPIIEVRPEVINSFQLSQVRHYDSDYQIYNIKCTKDNTNIHIYEDPNNNSVDINIGELQETMASDSIKEFSISLCGESNAVSYKLKAPARSFVADRRFNISGSNGLDNINFDLESNTNGRTVVLDSRLVINMDLNEKRDFLNVKLNHTKVGSVFHLAGKHIQGANIVFRDYAILEGNVYFKLEGDISNDDFFVDMHPGVEIASSANVDISIYGDEQQIIPNNIQAVHGSDSILLAYSGKIKGILNVLLHGDDGAFRVTPNRCFSTPCDLFEPVSSNTSELETQLIYNPDYAFDDVEAAIIIEPESSGQSNIHIDAGLGSDIAVLLGKETKSTGEHKHFLSGGLRYKGPQNDGCYAIKIEDSRSVNCNYYDIGLVHPYLQSFLD